MPRYPKQQQRVIIKRWPAKKRSRSTRMWAEDTRNNGPRGCDTN